MRAPVKTPKIKRPLSAREQRRGAAISDLTRSSPQNRAQNTVTRALMKGPNGKRRGFAESDAERPAWIKARSAAVDEARRAYNLKSRGRGKGKK